VKSLIFQSAMVGLVFYLCGPLALDGDPIAAVVLIPATIVAVKVVKKFRNLRRLGTVKP